MTGLTLVKFCKEMSEKFSIKIDSSFLGEFGEKEQPYWFWHSHPNKKVAAELLALTAEEEGGEDGLLPPEPFSLAVHSRVKEMAFKQLPGSNESKEEVLERANCFKQTVPATEAPILVISHSQMINALLSTQIIDGKFDYPHHVATCSLHPLVFD